jgi:hypothetical protein
MKIYRDGKAIELTKEELQLAYDEYDTYVKKRDLEETLKIMDIELLSECFDELLEKIDEGLADNDTYWNIYTETVEDVIYEYVEEREEN